MRVSNALLGLLAVLAGTTLLAQEPFRPPGNAIEARFRGFDAAARPADGPESGAPNPPPPSVEDRFRQWDCNSDGKLDRSGLSG
jgi:hypothetical protein